MSSARYSLTTTQHAVLVIENTFTAGTAQTGGQFNFQIPALPWNPNKVIVRQVSYDGTNAVANPVLLSSAMFGGPICSFTVSNSANNTVSNFCPNTEITILTGRHIEGSATFTCTQNGQPVTQLNGNLMLILELIKFPVMSREEMKR